MNYYSFSIFFTLTKAKVVKDFKERCKQPKRRGVGGIFWGSEPILIYIENGLMYNKPILIKYWIFSIRYCFI